ncbi:hypothetical protein C7M84_014540 [Penaeus vannamei]|uniref:RNA-directed DNA polymerase n=1 Tax=Penaeus vannamei TaxID=6689 RepID=A0A3R7QH96_PENVA|nr:hypothetical protein C7M84_014540 [Penaeus vannamei]
MRPRRRQRTQCTLQNPFQVEVGVHAVTTDHSSQRAPVNPRPLDQGITLHGPIPPYRAEVPASQPLRRNQELEIWLRHIEQAHPYGTDEALIRAARGSCRGTADIVVNSPVFDGIGTWDEFKETLRQRLRGTCSSMEYLRHLGSYVLGDTSPRDFYLAIETVVYQGMRDYPGELGPAEPLMRRTFLQGLPLWLSEKLLLIEDQPLYRVVEAAQKAWHHRHYAGRVEKPLVSFSSEAGPKPRSSTPREGRSPVDPLAELPVRTREPRRWCPYHQVTTHDASECRAVREGNQCTRCGRRGHNCRAPPNRTQLQPQRATVRDNDDAGAEGSDSSTEPELPEAQIQALLNCVVAGTKVLAFLDSGSEATVVKESCFRRISNTPLSLHPRGLRGASGAALDIKGRATLEFKFSRAWASSASFNGVRLGVSFSGAGSLGILTYHEPEAVLRCCSTSGGDREGAMRCARRVTCSPRAGRFVRCLVNGLKGGLACVESDTAKVLVPRLLWTSPNQRLTFGSSTIRQFRLRSSKDSSSAMRRSWVSLDRLEYDAESMDQDSGVNPEDVGSSSGDSRGALDIDDGSEPDSLMADLEDRFDFVHGLNDFGYNTDEFEVFPVCSFENEELPSSAGAVGVPRVNLAHLTSVQREQLVQTWWSVIRETNSNFGTESDNERALLQLVIPRSLRGAALDAVHAVPSAGHRDVHRTYQRLRDPFYFPGMLAASRRYVASCTACQWRKGAIARTPLQSMPDVAEPFERVSVDILTLTPSARGNKYVLVLIDHLTRFVELFPLASKDAQTVADVFLAEFVTRYGPPRTLLSDNGLEFRNRLLSDICHHLQLGWPLVRPPERLVSVGPPITIEGGGLDRGSITRGIWSLCIAALSCTPVTDSDPWVPDAFRVTAEFVPPDDFPLLDGTAPPDPESDMGPLQDPGADDLLDSESSAPSSEGVDDEPWDPGSDWDE